MVHHIASFDRCWTSIENHWETMVGGPKKPSENHQTQWLSMGGGAATWEFSPHNPVFSDLVPYLSCFSSISCLSCFEVLDKHKTYIYVNFSGWDFPSAPSNQNGYHQIMFAIGKNMLHFTQIKSERESCSSRHFLFCSDTLVSARDSLVSDR